MNVGKTRKNQESSIPPERTLKAIELLANNPKMSYMEAGIQSGYSRSTSRNFKGNILDKPKVISWLEKYKIKLGKYNIDQDRLALKLDALLDAKRPISRISGKTKTGRIRYTHEMVDDHRTQLETVKIIHEIFGVSKQPVEVSQGLSRRMTLEEFDQLEDPNEST